MFSTGCHSASEEDLLNLLGKGGIFAMPDLLKTLLLPVVKLQRSCCCPLCAAALLSLWNGGTGLRCQSLTVCTPAIHFC